MGKFPAKAGGTENPGVHHALRCGADGAARHPTDPKRTLPVFRFIGHSAGWMYFQRGEKARHAETE
jgi:hypothetical protein